MKASPSLKRKQSPSGTIASSMKKRRVESDDDSVTEPETEAEEIPAPPPNQNAARRVTPKANVDSGSETESDAEGEEESDQILQPRPAFVLAPGHKSGKPLVLDPGQVVPWKINTFLRDYQREGVEFFYQRYKEGRGGVLGDDMGLVRPSRSSPSSRRS
ncbi:uncharacterized protein B0H18DRAFT_213219 [Fomitopsis serialis]|uniref:uncharacterized protein n=1 Tax=Fomitopsis serialis TaxID=139415 RepID=UPI002008106F|nr:uncharacterized protein B0H18DRAFT_213219 [Neoantrodia serialis]KAH9929467.1 hypothetical protein B0H18DRAFT_213219 [Neoantrodia serialis]